VEQLKKQNAQLEAENAWLREMLKKQVQDDKCKKLFFRPYR
jgi:hypothetical protein